MEYDPAEVPALIEPIERGVADVVYGSRLRGGRPQRAYLFWHLVGNRFLSLLTNVLFNTTLSDMETGYKAFPTDAGAVHGAELHRRGHGARDRDDLREPLHARQRAGAPGREDRGRRPHGDGAGRRASCPARP